MTLIDDRPTLSIIGDPTKLVHFTTPDSPEYPLCGRLDYDAKAHIETDEDYIAALETDKPGVSLEIPITCGSCHYEYRNANVVGYGSARTFADAMALLISKYGAEAFIDDC